MDEPTLATHGMVSSPHYLASAAGLAVLRSGGNAIDAAVAAAGVLAVVYPHMCGIGGDCFMLIWDAAAGRAVGLNGSGRSPAAASIEALGARGLTAIPLRGGLPVTVPGVVDAWEQALVRHGSWPLGRVLEAAIVYAEDGFPATMRLARGISAHQAILLRQPALAQLLMRDGAVPRTGQRIVLPALARTLHRIAKEGASAFYRGDIARSIVQAVRANDGLLTEQDLESHHAEWVEPIGVDYHDLRVLEMPPNTQGLIALIMLKIIESFPMERLGPNSAQGIHVMVEAKKQAFGVGAKWITDPAHLEAPSADLLSPAHIAKLVDAMNARSAAPAARTLTPAGGDTVYVCAVDARGNACSLIQSVYFTFGSGVFTADSGVLLQNRGAFFSMDPAHPNALRPRKRTYHTLVPGLALRAGKPWLVFGTMGAEGQPQTQVQVLNNIVGHGMNVQRAIAAPRWLGGRFFVGDDPGTLTLEEGMPAGTAKALSRLGHDVRMIRRWDEVMGHAQAIRVDDAEGVLEGGADPRGDGLALGY